MANMNMNNRSCAARQHVTCMQEEGDDNGDDDAGCVGKASSLKVRNSNFGSKLNLAKVRVAEHVEIVWYMRVVKQGRAFELAPVRPALSMRATLTLQKGEVAQLV